ncbi:uncharacterized protein LOC127103487 [Lathyrus oleraceus]|uniref:uncharacterized protein LOC127103487 n=1 Tax=Pisum sativum TaxID=3888 RepID=UPI0021CFD4A0|nr:uncharacterized protein LOC127103487 [Pisum sativum]
MAAYSGDEKMLIHFFQDSLSGASVEWYIQLERSHVRSWRELAEAFLKHYQYNTDMAPNRMQLQSLTQKFEESFKEYAQRWRDLAARVQPPMLEKELVDMFMGTLQGLYYEKLVGSTSAGVKAGKIPNPANAVNGAKKPYGSFPKKKEGETNAASTSKGKRKAYRTPYYQVAEVTPNHYQPPTYAIPAAPQQVPGQPPAQYQQPNNYQQYPPSQQRPRRQERRLDPLPMSCCQLLNHLLNCSLIKLREARPQPSPLPPGYDANARCEFHTRAPGHTLDNCKELRYKVQDLLDSKTISFVPARPNVNNDPMPPHAGHPVNMIQESAVVDRISKVDMIKTPLLEVKKQLLLRNVFPGCTDDCARCGDTPQGCEELREVQIPVENAPTTPLVIVVPAPFPNESTKAVPWNYNSTAYLHGRKLEERIAKTRKTLVIHVPYEVPEPAEVQKLVEVQEPVVNIAGTSGMTRSGRIFAAPPPPEKENLGTNAKSKGKQPAGPEQEQTQTQGKVMPDDVEEFLRIINKSDYKVVDQLNQTPSKISILSLLLCSEAHRDALFKFLSAAHVPQEITVNQFEGVVDNIASKGCLGFCDDELPPEGKNHNKALHVSIECADTIMSRVLVDTGSSLNVLPKISLTKLTIEGLLMKPSALIMRAFDGSRRSIIGEVDLPIKIGPYTFFATFYVMDIHPVYSCLLGRPWIHAAGTVTSTLHQKLKFIISDKLVTIDGEEDILVSQLSSFRYVEVDGDIYETPFQAFEIANVLMNPLKGRASGKSELSMSSLKDAQTIIKADHPEGWGRILELPVNKNMSGLGYHPE